jgi:predicted AAA+ superfamily ATPase
MDQEKKNLLLSRDVGTLLMNVNRRAKSALHQYAVDNDLESYTLSDACREFGESPHLMWRTMRFWEHPNPTLLSLSRLAEVLRVDFEWLISGDHQTVKWREEADG